MINIKDKKKFIFQTDKNGYIMNRQMSASFYGDEGLIVLPVSSNGEVFETNYKRVKYFLDACKKNGRTYNICIDVRRKYNFSYSEWMYLIKLAKRDEINFLVNSLEEYSPEEMENYINGFVREDNGKHNFVFSKEIKTAKNNPFLKNRDLKDAYLRENDNYKFFNINKDSYEFDQYLKEAHKYYDDNVVLSLNVGESFDKKAKKRVFNIIDYMDRRYKNVRFNVSFKNHGHYYGKEEFENLLEVEEYIKRRYNREYELSLSGDGKLFNKGQVINANSKINDVVEYLKNSSLSPYEKVLYVHTLLKEFDYVYNKENSDLGRNVYSVLNTRNMICVGYAALFNAVFSELKDENIKCKMETITTEDLSSNIEWHALNCVYLKDEKYNVEGYYNIDACMNHKNDTLENFMIPPEDLKHSYAFTSVDTNKKIVYISGNLFNQSFPIQNSECNEKELNGSKLKYNDNIIRSSLDFLNTDITKKCMKELKLKRMKTTSDIIDVINKCVNESEAISLEKTKKCLQEVSKELYELDDEEAKIYAENAILKNCFGALFCYERNECSNDFAKHSILIENGNITLNKKQVSSR